MTKFLLIDGDGDVLGACLDADGVFVEDEPDGEVTVEIPGCLPARRLRDFLEGSKRYRLRNPLRLEGLRMLDVAGQPLVDFWVSEIIEWRPSALGDGRVDIVAEWGYDSPRASVRHVWERWRVGWPDRINQWAVYGAEGRREWLGIVGSARRWRVGGGDRPAGGVCYLDGTHVAGEVDFFLAMGEAINGPGGYFGWNLNAFEDCLGGGFGVTVPFTLVCGDAQGIGGSFMEVLGRRGVRVVDGLDARGGR